MFNDFIQFGFRFYRDRFLRGREAALLGIKPRNGLFASCRAFISTCCVARVVPSRTVRSESGRHACVTGYFCLDPRDIRGGFSVAMIPETRSRQLHIAIRKGSPSTDRRISRNNYFTSEEIGRLEDSFCANNDAM